MKTNCGASFDLELECLSHMTQAEMDLYFEVAFETVEVSVPSEDGEEDGAAAADALLAAPSSTTTPLASQRTCTYRSSKTTVGTTLLLLAFLELYVRLI